MTKQQPQRSIPGTAPDSDSGDSDLEPELVYPNFTEFAQDWLLPNTAVRIAGSGREGTYTWCPQWWRHRAVVVRIAALHEAFETAHASTDPAAMSSFLLHHVDPTMRALLDAANGPMHRCNTEQHTAVASLPYEPVPPDWF